MLKTSFDFLYFRCISAIYIKVDPRTTSLESSKLLIKSVYMKYDVILKELN